MSFVLLFLCSFLLFLPSFFLLLYLFTLRMCFVLLFFREWLLRVFPLTFGLWWLLWLWLPTSSITSSPPQKETSQAAPSLLSTYLSISVLIVCSHALLLNLPSPPLRYRAAVQLVKNPPPTPTTLCGSLYTSPAEAKWNLKRMVPRLGDNALQLDVKITLQPIHESLCGVDWSQGVPLPKAFLHQRYLKPWSSIDDVNACYKTTVGLR